MMILNPISRYTLVFLSAMVLALAGACTGLDTGGSGTEPARPVAEQETAPDWPHERSDLDPDPEVIYGQLDSGVRYLLMPNERPLDRVSMHLNVQAGSMHETDPQQGLAHFLEHLMFNGTEHFPPGEIVKYFQSIGMKFGPDANARTGFYETIYDILLPTGDPESLDDGLLVLEDFAARAHLLPAEIDKERRVILEEMRVRDSASWRTFVKTLQFEMPNARLSERLPIGKKETIVNADRDLLKDYYDTWYRPNRLVLVMVGDFDPDTAVPLIEKRFGAMAARAPERPEPPFGEIDPKGIQAFHHYENEAGNTQISIQVLGKKEPEPDTLERRKTRLIEDIANRIVQNRLNTLTKQPDSPFTDASAGSGDYLRYVRYGVMAAEADPDQWEDALALLEQTLRRALKYGFTQGELDRVRADYLASLNRAVKNASTRESGTLARQIIRSVNSEKVFQSPEQKKALYAPIIESLTLAQVHDAFKAVWDPDHRLIEVTGDADLAAEGTDPKAMILAAYGDSLQVAVTPPTEREAVAFPYLPAPETAGKIARRNEIADLGILQVDFENGVRLNLKQTDFEANEVIASLIFGEGESSEPLQKAGLSELSASVINESGVGPLDRDDLERALAGKNTALGFKVNQDDFAFRGRTVTDEVDLLFQLLYARLTDPAFRQEAYQVAMDRYRQAYQELAQSIDGGMTLKGRQFLAGGDPRFGLPPFEAFKDLTLDDIRSWIGPKLQNTPLELSIVGDFDTEKVIDLAARYLGSLPKRPVNPAEELSRLPRFPDGESLNITVDTKIPKGKAVVAYPTTDIWNIHRTRRLSTLASVFSDRLREEVREKLGATYSPHAYNQPSRAYSGYGVFQAVISINPDDADAVVKAVKEITTDLTENGVTEDELRRALDPTLTGIKDMRRENGYWLDTVLSGSREHPEQIEWSRTIVEDYTSITAEELTKMARTYLDNRKAAAVVIVPTHAIAEKGDQKTAG
ncbi:MAG: M16 family metallopeptidase [Thermodesulfobacteriota bacterium]